MPFLVKKKRHFLAMEPFFWTQATICMTNKYIIIIIKMRLLTWGLSHSRGKEADKPVKQISPGNFIGDQTTFREKGVFATWAHDHLLPHPEKAGWREGGTPSPHLYSAHNKVFSWWALKLSLLPKCFLVIKMLPTWWSTQAESSVCKYLNPSIGELFNSWNLHVRGWFFLIAKTLF